MNRFVFLHFEKWDEWSEAGLEFDDVDDVDDDDEVDIDEFVIDTDDEDDMDRIWRRCGWPLGFNRSSKWSWVEIQFYNLN